MTSATPMQSLHWNASLELQHPSMDDTHREFVQLLGELEAALAQEAPDTPQRLAAFVAHTTAHFEQEDRWMATIGFDKETCHFREHAHVLQVLQRVQQALVEEQDDRLLRRLLPELAAWFPQHAQSMDAGLAHAMQLTGYDVATDTLQRTPQPAAAGD
jgi:hemerythrin